MENYSEFKPITSGEEYLQKYWEGAQNKFVRYWVYLRKGMGLFNESKNYIMFAFAGYWTVKTSNLWLGYGLSDTWLILGFIIGIPIGLLALLFLGHWDLYRASKPQEYMNAQHGSITGYQGFNIQIEVLNNLREINKKLSNGKENNDI